MLTKDDLTLVSFCDNFMPHPRLVKNLINVPREGAEIIIDHNVFVVTRIRLKYAPHENSATVYMERIRSVGEDGW